MSETPPRADGPSPPTTNDDPWAAFGYLVAGVLFYGGIGLGLSLWLHAAYWTPIGVLVGVGFAFYLIFTRYRYKGTDSDLPSESVPNRLPPARRPPATDVLTADDQGETS